MGVIRSYANDVGMYESASGPLNDGDYLCDCEGLPIEQAPHTTEYVTRRRGGKPAGPKSQCINDGVSAQKFNWYCAGIGFIVATSFWSVCALLWGE
jgi:hypothetical protein